MSKYTFSIKSKTVSYEINLERKVTIIIGDSGTGKTTLCNMVDSAQKTKNIIIDSKLPLKFINADRVEKMLATPSQKEIVLFDEDNQFIYTTEFANFVNDTNTDKYFIIISRKNDITLAKLMYGISDVCVMHSSGKFNYNVKAFNLPELHNLPDCLVTEDSKSGYDFFKRVSEQYAIKCGSLCGKDNILRFILKNKDSAEKSLVIVDGLTFGPIIRQVLQLLVKTNNIELLDIGSFELMLLKSPMFSYRLNIDKIISTIPYNIASWERYFESLLKFTTRNQSCEYRKSGPIAPCYTDNCCKKVSICDYFLNPKQYANKLDTLMDSELYKILNMQSSSNKKEPESKGLKKLNL